MVKVIIVNGCATSGKDTFIRLCKDILGEDRVMNASSIDCIKKIATYGGWSGNKTPRDRKFLSDLKDLFTKWTNFPFKEVCKELKVFCDLLDFKKIKEDGALFICVREPEEIKKFVDALDATTIFVTRKEAEELETSNHADEEVFDYTYDYWIDNNGTIEDLKETAEFFLETLDLKKEEN